MYGLCMCAHVCSINVHTCICIPMCIDGTWICVYGIFRHAHVYCVPLCICTIHVYDTLTLCMCIYGYMFVGGYVYVCPRMYVVVHICVVSGCTRELSHCGDRSQVLGLAGVLLALSFVLAPSPPSLTLSRRVLTARGQGSLLSPCSSCHLLFTVSAFASPPWVPVWAQKLPVLLLSWACPQPGCDLGSLALARCFSCWTAAF